MSDSTVIGIAIQAMFVTAKVCAPILIVSLTIGFLVSLFQSVTQIQEFTLSFVPKLVGVGVVLLVTGSWMLGQLVGFTHQMFDMVPGLVRGG